MLSQFYVPFYLKKKKKCIILYAFWNSNAIKDYRHLGYPWLSEGLQDFGKGYHIEKSISPSSYQEHLTDFKAWRQCSKPEEYG